MNERVFFLDGRFYLARAELVLDRTSGDIRMIGAGSESYLPAGHPECERVFGLMAKAAVVGAQP